MKPRLLFLSDCAVPYQVRYCEALQAHFDAEFWFYEDVAPRRPAWWKVPLGPKCRILERVWMRRSGRYYALDLRANLERFDPHIVMIGGLSIPTNYRAYRWARGRGRACVAFTEMSRTRSGDVRKRSLAWDALRFLYRDLDLVIASQPDARRQFAEELGFGAKVVEGRYPSDLGRYFAQPLRDRGPELTLLFANRLTAIYDPLLALRIFARLAREHSGLRLLMNAEGELAVPCREQIAASGLAERVEFLSEIRAWDDLPRVYSRADVLLLPARFSNGNFTIYEAMASGLGIAISDRVLGNGAEIRDGVNGFRCEATEEVFAERLSRYIRSPELIREHGTINRQRAYAFGLEGTAELLHALLRAHLPPKAFPDDSPV